MDLGDSPHSSVCLIDLGDCAPTAPAAGRDTLHSVVTGRDAEMPHPQTTPRDDDDVERFLADLGRIGRQYVARAPDVMRPMRTAEMDQSLTEARLRLGQPWSKTNVTGSSASTARPT